MKETNKSGTTIYISHDIKNMLDELNFDSGLNLSRQQKIHSLITYYKESNK